MEGEEKKTSRHVGIVEGELAHRSTGIRRRVARDSTSEHKRYGISLSAEGTAIKQ